MFTIKNVIKDMIWLNKDTIRQNEMNVSDKTFGQSRDMVDMVANSTTWRNSVVSGIVSCKMADYSDRAVSCP